MNEIYNHQLKFRMPSTCCQQTSRQVKRRRLAFPVQTYGQKKKDGTTFSVRSSVLLNNSFSIATTNLTVSRGQSSGKTINAAHKLPSINKTKFLFINQKTYFVCLSFLFAKLAINKAMRHKKRSLLLHFSFTKHFYKKRQQNSRFFLNFAT